MCNYPAGKALRLVHTKNANCSGNYVCHHINGRSENALKVIPVISFLYAIIFNVVVSALLLGCGHISEISRTKKGWLSVVKSVMITSKPVQIMWFPNETTGFCLQKYSLKVLNVTAPLHLKKKKNHSFVVVFIVLGENMPLCS